MMMVQQHPTSTQKQTRLRAVVILAAIVLQVHGADHQIRIDFKQPAQTVDDRFVGVALDSRLIKDGWVNFDFSSEKLKTLATGLSPCYLRVGGTDADSLTFDPERNTFNPTLTPEQFHATFQTPWKSKKNFIMSGKDWDNLNLFVSEVGWDLIFDLNVLKRKEGKWSPENALVLFNYTVSKGYKVSGFQLGNEPNIFQEKFGVIVTPSALARDFGSLKGILSRYKQFRTSIIVGPDVTRVIQKSPRQYLEQFLASGGATEINRVSFHHYYMGGSNATVDDFMDPSLLDTLMTSILDARIIINQYSPKLPIWIGETASAYGGGAPGLSDGYVAGFMWLDKLGLSAKLGVKGLIRQSFYGGGYSLLDTKTLDPNPDYWLTLLYKRLVGNMVFNVTSSTETIRVYAHCTNTNSAYGYPPGSVTIYIMNLQERNLTMALPQFKGKQLHVFWLSPGDGAGLKSQTVKLGGKRLKLRDNKLPPLLPTKTSSNVINAPGRTFGFIVVPNAAESLCMR